jgi:hypothetical protein
MIINRDFWLSNFHKELIPEWPCPKCKKSSLNPVDNSFVYRETADTLKKEKLGDDVDDFKYRFSLFLKCADENCQESVACCGEGFVTDEYNTWDEEIGEYFPETVLVFSPKYFYPPLDLFSVPWQCPDIVEKEIKQSFSLFFADPSAAANSVRKVIEKILDDKDIPRDTEKGKFLPLEGKNGQNSRIGLFEQKLIENNKETKIIEYFRAIKFIGNEGSHAGEITKTDVLDAYEILELIPHLTQRSRKLGEWRMKTYLICTVIT